MPTQPPITTPTAPTPKEPLLSSHWKRNLLIGVGFVVLLLFVVMGIIGNSDVSKMACAAAQASPAVKRQLGEPIKRGFFTSGSIEESGSSGNADLSIPISGPKGKATLYVVARRREGLWKLETLQVAFSEGGARVDLLEEETGVVQP